MVVVVEGRRYRSVCLGGGGGGGSVGGLETASSKLWVCGAGGGGKAL